MQAIEVSQWNSINRFILLWKIHKSFVFVLQYFEVIIIIVSNNMESIFLDSLNFNIQPW